MRDATIETIATPIAPPTCCAVLISPDASPASCGSTPASAAIETGMKVNGEREADEQVAAAAGRRERAVHRDLRVPEHPGGDQRRSPVDQHRLRADPRRQRLREPGDEHRAAGRREEGQPGLQRRVAEHLLDVQRQQEEVRERRPRRAGHPTTFAPATVRIRKMRERHQRVLRRARSIDEEGDAAGRPTRRAARSSGRLPSRRSAPSRPRRRAARGRR